MCDVRASRIRFDEFLIWGAEEFSVAPHSHLNNLIIITIIAINIIDVKYPSDLQFALCIVRKIQFSWQKKKRKQMYMISGYGYALPHHNRSKPADSGKHKMLDKFSLWHIHIGEATMFRFRYYIIIIIVPAASSFSVGSVSVTSSYLVSNAYKSFTSRCLQLRS